MRKITSTYRATVYSPRIARKLGEPQHISQVRLVGSFPSKAAFLRAAVAAKEAARTPQVDKTMLGEGALVEHLEAETLYVCPVDAYGDRRYVRLDEYFPELRGTAGDGTSNAVEPEEALLERLRAMPEANRITAEQRAELYEIRDAAKALLAPKYEQLTCSELLDIAVAAHAPDGVHVLDEAAEAQSSVALSIVDRRHHGVDVLAEWEATEAPTFIDGVRALYDARASSCPAHRSFE